MHTDKELAAPSNSPADVLLIHPPVSKPAEPPAGVARLKQTLEAHGFSCRILDANLGGLKILLEGDFQPKNLREDIALRRRRVNLQLITSLAAYRRFDRYKASVLELNRCLAAASKRHQAFISLTDFARNGLSPLNSIDLLTAAEYPRLCPFYAYYEAAVIPTIERIQPKLIGISLVYLSQALPAFSLIGLLRRRFPKVRLVLGGGLISSWMSRPNWRNPFAGLIDRCIAGKGEAGLVEELGRPFLCKPTSLPNYDDTPPSAYWSPLPVLPYSASSGCWWRRCRFCPETAEQAEYEAIPPIQVLQDFESLGRYKIGLLHLLDNAVSPALLRRLAEEPLPAPWYGYARFTEELADPDFVNRLRRNGCVMLQLGLESGDQEVLDAMDKGIDLRLAAAALRCLKNAGIGAYVYLLFGTPWETEAQARRTLTFVVEHGEGICGINAAIFNMPSHCADSGEYSVRTFYDGDLSLYVNFDHPHGWNRPAVRRFLQNEFRVHPAVRRILNAVPPSFTSNHAPFFHHSFHTRRSNAHLAAV